MRKLHGKKWNALAIFIAIVLCIVSLVFTIKMRAQSCFLNLPVGPIVIYDEQLHPGWGTTRSANVTTINPLTIPGNQDGTYALQAQFGGNLATLEIWRWNISTTFLDTLTFWIRKEDAVGNISVVARFALRRYA